MLILQKNSPIVKTFIYTIYMPPKLYVLLDNIRSAYNVGSVFRTCDSAGVDQLFLTGYTCTPPHPKLKKTALGSTQSVNWQHHCQPFPLIQSLKTKHINILSLEPINQAKSIYDVDFNQPSCLVFGNEERGISPDILSQSHQILAIPQFGFKESLNIATAAGIAIYEFKRKLLYP